MRWVKIGGNHFVNLDNVTDTTYDDKDKSHINFYLPFLDKNGEQAYITAKFEYAPELIKNLRNGVYPFSDNRG